RSRTVRSRSLWRGAPPDRELSVFPVGDHGELADRQLLERARDLAGGGDDDGHERAGRGDTLEGVGDVGGLEGGVAVAEAAAKVEGQAEGASAGLDADPLARRRPVEPDAADDEAPGEIDLARLETAGGELLVHAQDQLDGLGGGLRR